MRYFEAKVLVPVAPANRPPCFDGTAAFEGRLLARYGGFHVGPEVQGQTLTWGSETMRPYYIGAVFADGYCREGAAYELATRLADDVKEVYGEETVYVAVTELAGPFIR
jgi:hypothetical protein